MAESGDAGAKAAWIGRVLGVQVGGGTAATGSGLAAWQTARAAVIGTLRELEAAIRGMADPDGDAAIILVRAISANLTAAPTTPQQVAELERYLNTDRIIDEAERPNGFGIRVRIRAALLPPLAALRAAA